MPDDDTEIMCIGVQAPLVNLSLRTALPGMGVAYGVERKAGSARVYRAIVPLDDLHAANIDPQKRERLGKLITQAGSPVGHGEASDYFPDLDPELFDDS
ncbi:hypothetical protein [uncultured Ruegeria sp.]|uniref:hypothetical protein n=1 Tax=uncultured Ruegeria sp. TaxID=259304 RepID=UPI00260FADFF|nr:hypothetical protein [uncultured Ruegeria sp.]